MSNPTASATGTVRCDNCGAVHVAEYSHEGRFGQGAIYAVVCPVDYMTDYYTAEVVAVTK